MSQPDQFPRTPTNDSRQRIFPYTYIPALSSPSTLLPSLTSHADLSVLDAHTIGVRMRVELLLLKVTTKVLGLRDGAIFVLKKNGFETDNLFAEI